MKRLTIIVPEGDNNLSSIVGAYKIFSRANAIWKGREGEELFTIELAGTSPTKDFYGGIFSVRPHTMISNVSQTDLIIVPSLNHAFDAAIEQNKVLIQWLRTQYQQGAEIASICTGAFLLAAAGILEGKSCSTHWAATDDFKHRFPNVNVQSDKIITEENGIYTNGGAYSFLNLILYLIEKYFDRQTAIYCSKVFQIEMDRHSQSSFMIFNGQKEHGDDLVRAAQSYIEEKMAEKISFEQLSAKFAIGRRNFDRRFVKATGNTPLEYFQRIKIEAAKRAFETTRKTINEVMYEVGYSDLKAFREVFRKITGMSPLDYRSRYNKEALPGG
ncbi:GlxA family transcriptional regulator [Chitinophaga sp. sic0106]|uniref:GlxA family transcriptional regulator n=1 Tax=Chitinophaga sp. sic0106 TaxID=2854785 RepID=UPI001C449E5B|nr:helix-turn-helix domain-containing protein [Chitinophaga sp. sic0106]MBV7529872.1 helix-turn-helix domain-containing protein [Chitinophaga sp. sic0106]